jgi:three-Cys-motif partner protein
MPLEIDQIGIWSEVKLDIVRRYALEYSKIVSSHGFYHIYIDAFAGAGKHQRKKTHEEIPGSPMIALAIQPPFREYHFIDANFERAENLRFMTKDRPEVTVHTGDCNEILLNDIFPKVRYEDRKRALCLLDPYNINLRWDVVARAGQSRSIEVFVNFMIMGMNRNTLRRNPEKVTEANKDRMDRFWGDRSWFEAAFHSEMDQGKLFVEMEEKVSNEQFAAAYRERLKKVAGFRYVPRPLPMKTEKQSTIYYLYFASPNSTANKIVEYIFGKYRKKQAFDGK